METRTELHFGDRLVRCYVQRPPNVNALLRDAWERAPGRDAVVDERRRVDWATLAHESACVAAGLAGQGLAAGDRIVLLAGNCVEFAVALLAAWRIGAVIVPLNPRNARDEVGFVVGQCGAAAILFERTLADRIPARATMPGCRLAVCIGAATTTGPGPDLGPLVDWDRLAATPPLATLHDAPQEAVAMLLYTSGTTGRPKGAMLTHLNLVHSALHFRETMGLRDAERSLLAVPFSHVTGLVAVFLTMVSVAGTTVMIREFKSGLFLATAAAERITHAIVVPAIYNLLLRDPGFASHDLSSWRFAGFGGAPMPEPTIEALARAMPQAMAINAYGATETSSPVSVMPPGSQREHLDSTGLIVPCGDVLIMDDDGREVPPGATGEIWIGGPMVVPGYWDNPEATRREFCGGYWKSGDLGSKDAEGFLRVFDRKKDMINRGGYKVYGAEVESVLAAHPAVLEAAIVAEPDPVLGEKSRAHLVVSQPVTPEELREFCAGRLADYKIPDFYTFRSEPLPRNPNGKILKRMLR